MDKPVSPRAHSLAGVARLPLNALRVFEAAARSGSFLQASRDLSITPAAVSRHIKRLEADLGVRLFERFNRAVRLTEPGAQLAAGVGAGLARILESVERVRPAEDGPLVVSTTASIAGRWLTPRLQEFLDANPDIDVVVDASDRAVDLARERVDVALRFGRGPYPGLRAERLIATRQFPVCSPALVEELGLRTPADLERATLFHEVLYQSVPEPGWDEWFACAGAPGVRGRRGATFSNNYLAVEAARSGRGVVLAHEALVLEDLASGRLVRPFPHVLESPLAYWIVCLPERADRPRVRRFRRWLRARARADGLLPQPASG
jgi:LysR family glycine cleavage system transcriptional activator